MWIRNAAAVGVMALVMGACMAADTAPATQPEKKISVTGTLKAHVMAIGGETTGTQLREDANTVYDLDLSGDAGLEKKADELDGKRALAEGTLTTVHGVEGKDRMVIHVTTLESAMGQK